MPIVLNLDDLLVELLNLEIQKLFHLIFISEDDLLLLMFIGVVTRLFKALLALDACRVLIIELLADRRLVLTLLCI